MPIGMVGPRLTGTEAIIWKTEGLSDAAALMSLGLPEDHGVWTNGHGAMEMPSEELCSVFDGTPELFVVHDCDKPGQKGSLGTPKKRRFAHHLARYANEVRNVVLPYPIEETNGKDLKDWIYEQREAGKSDGAIYEELLAMARQAERIPPCSETLNGDEEPGLPGEAKVGAVVEEDDDPHRLARVNLERYTNRGGRLVVFEDEFWRYRNGVYRRISKEDLRAKLTESIREEFERCWKAKEEERLEAERESKRGSEPTPILKVTEALVNNVMNATRSICRLAGSAKMPSYLPTREKRPYLSLKNGILDFAAVFADKPLEECLLPHTSDWFSTVQALYSFDENADCPHWKAFLQDAFNGDREQIEALQMWFGYVLTQDTHLHKMLMVIGQARSGKGTIASVLRKMIGEKSVGTPTINQLGGQFELHTLADKTLAIIPDARLSKKSDHSIVTERLLSIVGGDPQNIQRKNLPTLQGVEVLTRFMLLSNELPGLSDSSAAIVNRAILLNMPNTYLGREDYKLGEKLEAELPGILWWSICGAGLLAERGRIEQPEAGKDLLRSFRQIVSPVSQFLSECCQRGGEANIEDLFEAYCEWGNENNIGPITKPTFAKQMIGAAPYVSKERVMRNYQRLVVYRGISMKEEDPETLF